ncbi:MAG: hypothetical protein AAB692_01155, partial [Patescibacteria group bacterium]
MPYKLAPVGLEIEFQVAPSYCNILPADPAAQRFMVFTVMSASNGDDADEAVFMVTRYCRYRAVGDPMVLPELLESSVLKADQEPSGAATLPL